MIFIEKLDLQVTVHNNMKVIFLNSLKGGCTIFAVEFEIIKHLPPPLQGRSCERERWGERGRSTLPSGVGK